MITIINNDCLQALKEIPDNSIDCVITSPPYNIGKKYATYNDKREDYLEWTTEWTSEVARVLTSTGSLFLNIGWTTKELLLPYKVLGSVTGALSLQNNIIWVKHIKVQGETHGLYRPSTSKYHFGNTWEHLFHFTKQRAEIDTHAVVGEYDGEYKHGKKYREDHQRYTKERQIARKMGYKNKKEAWNDERYVSAVNEMLAGWTPKEEMTKDEGAVWYISTQPLARSFGYMEHPAMFPEELAERCIKMTNAQTILDPFAGSFTTGVAAKNLNRNFIGIEISKEYCELGRKRLNDNTRTTKGGI